MRTFAPDTGRVESIYAQTLLTTPIQDLDFTFDALGNLTGKTDVRRSLTETYDYDGLNRLTDVSGSSSLTMTYDGLGNITSKSDVGSYLYAGPRPHAVTTAGGVGYLYDGNGNLTSGDGRSNSYTLFNKPYLMSQAGIRYVAHDPRLHIGVSSCPRSSPSPTFSGCRRYNSTRA